MKIFYCADLLEKINNMFSKGLDKHVNTTKQKSSNFMFMDIR